MGRRIQHSKRNMWLNSNPGALHSKDNQKTNSQTDVWEHPNKLAWGQPK